MFPSSRGSVGLLLAVYAGQAGLGAAAEVPAVVQFNRDIRPIMSNTCFKCHGPDVKSNKSDLRLDLPDAARAPHQDRTGRVFTPIVPGRPAASEVWRRITSRDATLVMPPPDTLHQLSDHDRALFKRWIEQGAKYQPHWAYLPPVKVPAPPVRHAGAVHNAIDPFVLAELERRGLESSPEADRRTLFRRVTLDLIGLPPTPGETAAFLADTRPGAYERAVDRLLASPHYGERMAVPWLDVVRFGESAGFHGDQLLNNFPYRDFVIDAFNHNKPFDQFTIEQLAGDLLPNATPVQRTASGFNRLNLVTREGGAQSKEYLAKYAADRVRAVSTTWLGSTMACSECHDHKYDPFTTKDFYSLAAYFADIKEWGVYKDHAYAPEPELAGFTDGHPFPPEIEVENEHLQRRLQRFRGQLRSHLGEAVRAVMAEPARVAALREWTAQVRPRLLADAGGWGVLVVEKAVAAKGDTAALLPDHSVRFEGPPPKDPKSAHPQKLVLLPPAGPVATIRLEVLPDEVHGGTVARNQELSFTVELALAVQRAGAPEPQPLAIAEAYADRPTETYAAGRTVISLRERWKSDRRFARLPQATDFFLRQPLVLAEGDRLMATIGSADAGRVRVSVSPLGTHRPGEGLTAEERTAFAAIEPTPAQDALLAAEYVRGTGAPDAALYAEILRDVAEIAECCEGRALMTITVATAPRIMRVLPRGNWQDESGEVVLPAPPHFLTGAVPASGATRQTRLDLARWLVSRQNPLTARAFVNRLWQQFFGNGLSLVLDDVGMQGEYPSHPELLDWLAVEFMDSGWDMKALVRLLVTSGTYRQDTRYRADCAEVDPNNRLLARQNPRRLDAEFVRDNALFAAGLLNLELGGPSAWPYQPEGYYSSLNNPGRDYVADTDERQYRRGVYVHRQRTFLHPMLANFDAPAREECAAGRTLSSTPQQALTLLNDPTFVEAARALAEQVLAGGEPLPFSARLEIAFLRLFARVPEAEECESLGTFYGRQLAHFQAQPQDARKLLAVGLHPAPAALDAVELAAWTSLARVLLNLNETIVRY